MGFMEALWLTSELYRVDGRKLSRNNKFRWLNSVEMIGFVYNIFVFVEYRAGIICVEHPKVQSPKLILAQKN